MTIKIESAPRLHWTTVAFAVLAAGCGGSTVVEAAGAGGAPGAGGAAQIGGAAGAGGIVQVGGAAGAGGVLSGGAAGSAVVDSGADRADAMADVDAGADGSADATDSMDAADSSDAADAADAQPIKCPAGVAGHCSSTTYPTYPGFTLVLAEDFDEPIDLVNDPVWTYSDGFGDNRYTRYKKEAITFTGGNAVITATAPPGGVVNTGYPTYAEGTLNDFPSIVTGTTTVQSGELRTKYNNYRYGRCEFRMKAPRNSNVIASLWTFRTPKWQDWRETRVEITPANASNAAGTNIIWGQNAAAYGNTSNSYKATTVTTLAAGATIFDDFHTYAVQMTPAQVTWSVDGTVIRTETGTGVKLPDMSMKLLINLWVFPSNGWGGGIPSANVYPMHSETDWIRFYKWDQEPTYPCSPTPSCLPVDDRDYAKNNAEDGVAAAPPW